MREEYGGFVFARDLVLGSTVDVFDTVLFIIFFFFLFVFTGVLLIPARITNRLISLYFKTDNYATL